MPFTPPSLSWNLHGVEDVGDLPVTEPLFPKLFHLLDIGHLPLVDHLSPSFNPVPIAEGSLSSDVLARPPQRDLKPFEVLADSAAGGRN